MTEKGTWSLEPMAPLSTRGTATQKLPTIMMGIASRQLRPTERIADAVCHVAKLIVSVLERRGEKSPVSDRDGQIPKNLLTPSKPGSATHPRFDLQSVSGLVIHLVNYWEGFIATGECNYTHISIRPYVRRSERSVLLRKLPGVEGGEPPPQLGRRRLSHGSGYLGSRWRIFGCRFTIRRSLDAQREV